MKRFLTLIKLRRYVRVKVYLRSGQTVSFKCKEWEAKGSSPASGGKGLQSYSFKDIKGKVLYFDIHEIVALEGDQQ